MEAIPLYELLGIKDGFKIKLINEPDYFLSLLERKGKNFFIQKKLSEPVDLIYLFTKSKKELSVELPALKNYIKKDGIFWISWPNKSAHFGSDLDNNIINQIGIMNGFVVSKICSINHDWSATKLTVKKNGDV